MWWYHHFANGGPYRKEHDSVINVLTRKIRIVQSSSSTVLSDVEERTQCLWPNPRGNKHWGNSTSLKPATGVEAKVIYSFEAAAVRSMAWSSYGRDTSKRTSEGSSHEACLVREKKVAVVNDELHEGGHKQSSHAA